MLTPNKYQKGILDFFSARKSQFLDFMMKVDEKNVVTTIDDLFKFAHMYLDTEIRSEMGLYDRSSERHRFLTDILIELHLHNKTSEFGRELHETAGGAFLADPPC